MDNKYEVGDIIHVVAEDYKTDLKAIIINVETRTITWQFLSGNSGQYCGQSRSFSLNSHFDRHFVKSITRNPAGKVLFL